MNNKPRVLFDIKSTYCLHVCTIACVWIRRVREIETTDNGEEESEREREREREREGERDIERQRERERYI